jgi:hypothetical protein
MATVVTEKNNTTAVQQRKKQPLFCGTHNNAPMFRVGPAFGGFGSRAESGKSNCT